MKRKSTKYVTALLIVFGVLFFIAGCQSDEANENDSSTSVERSIDTEGEYPWDMAAPSELMEHLENGEQIFEFSDGEALENRIIDLTSNEKKENYSESWAKYIGMYINQLEEHYPNQQDYFDKMQEIQSDLENNAFDRLADKVTEAIKLREQ